MTSVSDDVEHPDSCHHGAPAIPPPSDRMPVKMIPAPHPATLSMDNLGEACDLRTQRRSGPGGQHRNKTSSGVFLYYPTTGTTSEATERRSQADNRVVALGRLRFRLAVEVRTPSAIDGSTENNPPHEQELRARYHNHPLKLNDRNEDKPALVALLLNDLHAAGGQPSAVASHWKASTSSIIRLLKSHPPAFRLLNQIRKHHDRRPLS